MTAAQRKPSSPASAPAPDRRLPAPPPRGEHTVQCVIQVGGVYRGAADDERRGIRAANYDWIRGVIERTELAGGARDWAMHWLQNRVNSDQLHGPPYESEDVLAKEIVRRAAGRAAPPPPAGGAPAGSGGASAAAASAGDPITGEQILGVTRELMLFTILAQWAAHTAHGALPRAQARKTVAHGPVDSFTVSPEDKAMSGWIGRNGYYEVDPAAVAALAGEMGAKLPAAGALDQRSRGGFPGRYYASHAEKKYHQATGGESIGISQPMCSNCIPYFQALASHGRKVYITVDPDAIRIFLPDGRMFVIFPNGNISISHPCIGSMTIHREPPPGGGSGGGGGFIPGTSMQVTSFAR